MDFISLDAVIDSVAACVDGTQFSLDHEIAEEAKYSEAAALLDQCLGNGPADCLRWFDLKPTGKPKIGEKARTDGLAMLAHMLGWYGRQRKARNDHVAICLARAIDPNDAPQEHDLGAGKYDWRHYFMREHEIGFDRPELIGFLNKNGILHKLGDSDEVAPSPTSDISDSTSSNPRVAWRIVVCEQIKNIDNAHGGKANVREAIQWLRKHGGDRILKEGEHHELKWLDDNRTPPNGHKEDRL